MKPEQQDMFAARFEQERAGESPLAARMRPNIFDDYVGQEHIIGPKKPLRRAIEADKLPSMVLWGPPGSGKTTLAHIIASTTNSHFSHVSAVSAGVAELRKKIDEAIERRRLYRQRTILFIDEIHRFNKAQQDAILPYVEDGTITLIGATTENPSFEVIAPLLSRCQVYALKPLSEEELRVIILRAMKDSLRGLGTLNIELSPDAMTHLIMMSNNDARTALNALELAAQTMQPDAVDNQRHLTLETIEEVLQKRAIRYDKSGEEHFDVISALHKSMRGSDPDAALYWLAKMLEAGEDPLYIARRLVRFASEDVGLADPHALVLTIAAQQAVHFIGMPEGSLALAEAVVYLASAPKSNSLYTAYSRAQQAVNEGVNEPVPFHLRNAVTPLMKEQGYGKGYKYAHDYPEHFVHQQYLPDSLKDAKFYFPSDQGYEPDIVKRLRSWWENRRESK